MATLHEWVEGARPRTLPAALAPVIAGTAVAAWEDRIAWLPALLCLLVSLALQVGVNYANDYSDGIRGTDDARVGPVRLVGQRLAAPGAVKAAAIGSLAVAAIAGLALTAITGHWWLLAVGAAAMASAWLYTGGPRPYGYAGLGEVFVFVFFGLVAVCGTAYVQTGAITALALLMGVSQGAVCCAILVANNLRDIPGDTVAGKQTLAVRMGDPRTRSLYLALVGVAVLVPVLITLGSILGAAWPALALLGAGAAFPAAAGVRVIRSGALGRDLIPVLGATGRAMLAGAGLFAVGVGLSLI